MEHFADICELAIAGGLLVLVILITDWFIERIWRGRWN